jgi:phosphate-selective porin OprO/OprP
MHLGITGRYAGNDNGTDHYRLRAPERSGLSPAWLTYANTQPFHATGGTQDINIECVNVFGPWTIDAEYDFHWNGNAWLGSSVGTRQTSVGTLFYSGGYVEVLYFLTGEHRAYIREGDIYDRIIPRQDAFWIKGKDGKPNEHGLGAWQVGIRYNYLNLNDKGINGGDRGSRSDRATVRSRASACDWPWTSEPPRRDRTRRSEPAGSSHPQP